MKFLNQLSLKSRLTILLLIVSLSSLLAAGILSWLRFRNGFQQQVFQHLTSVRAAKGNQIEAYLEGIRNQTDILSQDRTVISSMIEFNSAYRELKNKIIPSEWLQTIESHYAEELFAQLAENNIQREQVFANYVPSSQAGQYLQYQYIANNRFPVGEKDKLVQAQDDSNYTQFHRKYHPFFQNLLKKLGYSDVLLIDFNTGEVVYSVQKTTDYATNLEQGPYRRSNLAEVVEAVRDNPGQGFVQVIDFQPYTPAVAALKAFFAAPIYNGPHIVGILAIQLPIEPINQILTGNEDWERDGLGETGEAYLVGSDLLMRSMSRFLIEDPAGYDNSLRQMGLSAKTIDLIQQFKTSVLLQPVNTPAAQAAIAGLSDTQMIKGYRGISVLSSYGSLRIEGLKWGIIAEIDRSEALQPVYDIQTALIILAAILILLMTFLSGRIIQILTQPIQTLIDAARQVKQGETDIKIQLENQGEFADLGQAFNSMVDDIRDQKAIIQQNNRENQALLSTLFPDSVITRVRQGEKPIFDSVKQTTVLVVKIINLTSLSSVKSTQEITEIFNKLIDAFDEKVEEYSLEKQNTLGENYIAVCGLSKTYLDHPERSLKCAMDLFDLLPSMNQEYHTNLSLQISLHSGPISAGVVGTQKISYKLWGETLNIVTQLNTIAPLNSILVTQAIQERLQDQYLLLPYQSIATDNDPAISAWMLVTPTQTFAKQAELVQRSFTQIIPEANATAELFYQRLFELSPSIRAMFKGDMKQQQHQFMDTLQIAVNGLNKLDKLLPTLQTLGDQYAEYGVKTQDYETVGQALLLTLEQQLGSDFTPAVKDAWMTAYTLISSVIREAITLASQNTQKSVTKIGEKI